MFSLTELCFALDDVYYGLAPDEFTPSLLTNLIDVRNVQIVRQGCVDRELVVILFNPFLPEQHGALNPQNAGHHANRHITGQLHRV